MQYHNITKDDMLNGDGLRVVLWVAGCGHACPGCHNPIMGREGGLLFDQAAKAELFTELGKDYISGITFSGGDPLFPGKPRGDQRAVPRDSAKSFRIRPSGCIPATAGEEIKWLPFLDQIDVLIDGRFVQAQADPQLHWRGSANQRVIDVPRTLAANSIVLHDDK